MLTVQPFGPVKAIPIKRPPFFEASAPANSISSIQVSQFSNEAELKEKKSLYQRMVNWALSQHAEVSSLRNKFKRIFNSVLSHIQQRESTDIRLRLMVSAQEQFNVVERNLRKKLRLPLMPVKVDTPQLAPFERYNNVTKFTEAHFLPLQALQMLLDSKSDHSVLIQKCQSLLLIIKAQVAIIQNKTDRALISGHIEEFEKEFNDLLAHKDDKSFYKTKHRLDADKLQEGQCFRIIATNLINQLIHKLTNFKYDFESIFDIRETVITKKGEIDNLKDKETLAFKIREHLNPLVAKDNLLKGLRFLLANIATPVDGEIAYQEAIKNAVDKDHPELKDQSSSKKLEVWNKEQQSVQDALLEFIKTVSQTPGSYVEVKELHEHLDEIFKELDSKKAYLFSKKGIASTKFDLRDKLNVILFQQTQYLSTIEILYSLQSSERIQAADWLAELLPQKHAISEFAFKSDLECGRELLMRSMLEEMGELAQFFAPKFDFKTIGFSLNGKISPAGVASLWISSTGLNSTAWNEYHKEVTRMAQRDFYKRVISEKPKVESDLKEATGKLEEYDRDLTRLLLDLMAHSCDKKAKQIEIDKKRLDAVEENIRIEVLKRKLEAIKESERSLLNTPSTYLAFERKKAVLRDPRSQEGILVLGFFDIVFVSPDTHRNQIRFDKNGVPRNVDAARFLLPYFLHSHLGEIYAIFRSCLLDHPFAAEEMPQHLIDLILAFDAEDIVRKWRKKELIADDGYFAKHNQRMIELKKINEVLPNLASDRMVTFKMAGCVDYGLDQNPQVEIDRLKEELKRLGSKETEIDEETDTMRSSEIKKAKKELSKLRRAQEFISRGVAFILFHFQHKLKLQEDQLSALEKFPEKSPYKDNLVKESREKIVKSKDSILQVKKATTLRELMNATSPEITSKFLESEIAKQLNLNYSKLHELSAQQFIDNLTNFQKYLLQKKALGRASSLREGFETAVYPFLKPFLDMLQRIEEKPYEHLAVTTIDKSDHYTSLAHVLARISANSKLYTSEELERISKIYEDIKQGQFGPVGTRAQNLISIVPI